MSKKINHRAINLKKAIALLLVPMALTSIQAQSADPTSSSGKLNYKMNLTSIPATDLLGDYPQFARKIEGGNRYEANVLINDNQADLYVRAWRYSYNARGIIEIPNYISGKNTVLIVVHPWGIDEPNGIPTAEPNGVTFFCTPQKNLIYQQHVKEVLNPFIQKMRKKVKQVAFSLPGSEDNIRKFMYRSIDNNMVDDFKGRKSFNLLKQNCSLVVGRLKDRIEILNGRELVYSYFLNFAGLDSSRYFNSGFNDIPIPLTANIDVANEDIVVYDKDGYEKIKNYLCEKGIRNILLCGYATDVCYKSTTAGYDNFRKDFNVFLVGDATMATFPALDSPADSTTVALSKASVNNLITQISWIKTVK